jgi:hypothetical protein
VGQQSAVRSAESYLRYTGFSRVGLIRQLRFEGFTDAEAVYAVDHITVDWHRQASRVAESYLRFSGFSRTGLVGQLLYEGFTPAEAQYGASSVGL